MGHTLQISNLLEKNIREKFKKILNLAELFFSEHEVDKTFIQYNTTWLTFRWTRLLQSVEKVKLRMIRSVMHLHTPKRN